MSTSCARRDVLAGLKLVGLCGDSARLAPGCVGGGWTDAAASPGEILDATTRHSRKCARDAAEAFLCGLPLARRGHTPVLPPDWAFGADPPSLGKFVARWAMELWLGSGERPARRYALPVGELAGWRWLPNGVADAICERPRDASAWLRADVCAAAARRRPAEAAAEHAGLVAGSRAGRQLLELVRGNASGGWRKSERADWVATAGGGRTSAGLWWAAQLVRLARGSLGACGDRLVRSLLAERRRVNNATAGAAADAGAFATTVAIHVRRGDACERWARRGDGRADGKRGIGRPCYRADDYVAAAVALLPAAARAAASRHGARRAGGTAPTRARFLVASDAPGAAREVAAAVERQGGGHAVVALEIPRGAGWGGAAEGDADGLPRDKALAHFIETRNEKGLIDRRRLFGALFADLQLLSRADAFVGTAASWTSRLVLLAIAGEIAAVPPFAMVDKPLGQLWFA